MVALYFKLLYSEKLLGGRVHKTSAKFSRFWSSNHHLACHHLLSQTILLKSRWFLGFEIGGGEFHVTSQETKNRPLKVMQEGGQISFKYPWYSSLLLVKRETQMQSRSRNLRCARRRRNVWDGETSDSEMPLETEIFGPSQSVFKKIVHLTSLTIVLCMYNNSSVQMYKDGIDWFSLLCLFFTETSFMIQNTRSNPDMRKT